MQLLTIGRPAAPGGNTGICLGPAHRTNDGADVADLGDSKAEVFPDFDGFAVADGFVVDAELEGFFAAALEFDDGADAKAKDLGEVELSLREHHDHWDAQVQNAAKLGLIGRAIGVLAFDLEDGHWAPRGQSVTRNGVCVRGNLAALK
jgi:hypothetical protein